MVKMYYNSAVVNFSWRSRGYGFTIMIYSPPLCRVPLSTNLFEGGSIP
jgi:hypothetical protein